MLRPEAGWCGQCFAPVGAPSLPPVPVAAEQVLLPTYTRWRKTDTKFGPVGRVAWSLGVLLALSIALFSQDPFAIVPTVVVGTIVLRSVWATSRLT